MKHQTPTQSQQQNIVTYSQPSPCHSTPLRLSQQKPHLVECTVPPIKCPITKSTIIVPFTLTDSEEALFSNSGWVSWGNREGINYIPLCQNWRKGHKQYDTKLHDYGLETLMKASLLQTSSDIQSQVPSKRKKANID